MIVVLVAFGSGCALGVLAMVPAWWKHRRIARRNSPATTGSAEPDATIGASATNTTVMPYDGI